MLFFPGAIRNWYLVTLFMLCLSCAHKKKESQGSALKESQRDLSMYQVVDCRDSNCGPGLEIVPLSPFDDDITALGINGTSAASALDESIIVEEVENKEAAAALKKAGDFEKVLAPLFFPGSENNVFEVGLLSLFRGFTLVKPTDKLYTAFISRNILGKDPHEKDLVLNKIQNIANLAAGKIKTIDPKIHAMKLNTLIILGGEDGWLNHGDQSRLIGTIPNIVGQGATESRAMAFSEAIAEDAVNQRGHYRRWLRKSNGIIGTPIYKSLAMSLKSTYKNEWVDACLASEFFQTAFYSELQRMGVKSYFLFGPDKKNYFDPADAPDGDFVERLASNVFDHALDELISKNPPQPKSSTEVSHFSELISLPDGLPIDDIEQIFRAGNNFTKAVYPKNISFEINSDGKLELRRLRAQKNRF